MITVGIVGIGRWGRNLLRCFDQLADVAYCCHNGSEENATWLNETFPGIELTEDYERILLDQSVDAIVVATPVDSHGPLARRALRADKHLFVEKPLTGSGWDSANLVALADRRDRRLFTGYVFLYAPAMRELVSRTRKDSPVHVSAAWNKFGTFDDQISRTLVAHDIAIGQRLFGEPFVEAAVTESAGIRTESDILTATFETSKGGKAVTRYDRSASHSRKSVVVVTREKQRYEFVNDRLLHLEGDEHRDITPSESAPLTEECASFVDWIEGGSRPPTAGEFGVAVDRTLDRLG